MIKSLENMSNLNLSLYNILFTDLAPHFGQFGLLLAYYFRNSIKKITRTPKMSRGERFRES